MINIFFFSQELLTAKSPYEDLEVENLDELIVEICVKKTREKIPNDCVPSLKKVSQFKNFIFSPFFFFEK